MKKFLILMSAGVAFAFASCSASKTGSCCGKCKTACAKTECATKTECAACTKDSKTCATCTAKKN